MKVWGFEVVYLKVCGLFFCKDKTIGLIFFFFFFYFSLFIYYNNLNIELLYKKDIRRKHSNKVRDEILFGTIMKMW